MHLIFRIELPTHNEKADKETLKTKHIGISNCKLFVALNNLKNFNH